MKLAREMRWVELFVAIFLIVSGVTAFMLAWNAFDKEINGPVIRNLKIVAVDQPWIIGQVNQYEAELVKLRSPEDCPLLSVFHIYTDSKGRTRRSRGPTEQNIKPGKLVRRKFIATPGEWMAEGPGNVAVEVHYTCTKLQTQRFTSPPAKVTFVRQKTQEMQEPNALPKPGALPKGKVE